MVLGGRWEFGVTDYRTEEYIQHRTPLKVRERNVILCGFFYVVNPGPIFIWQQFTEKTGSKEFPYRRMIKIPSVLPLAHPELHSAKVFQKSIYGA